MTRAIPTEHLRTGIGMRSALEARWADVLDRIGVGWSYEPELVRLGRGGPRGGWLGGYVPDFRLDGLDAWLEVKGPHLHRIEKTQGLARLLGEKGLVLVGTSVGVAWRMLPSGKPDAPEIGYGVCRCGLTAVGPLVKRRGRPWGPQGIECRGCGRGLLAQGVLGW